MEVDLPVVSRQVQAVLGDIARALPSVGVALVVFLVFFLAARWVRALVRRVSDRRRKRRNLGMALGRLAQLGILAVGLLVAVTIIFPSFRPGDLITLLGVSGVAVGFAFKDIFQNYLAGILILLTEPFRVGDQIVVGSFEGTVEEIETRATFIRTYDGRRVVIPNADLYTDKVVVNTAYDRRRVQLDVGIGYGDDIGRAKALVHEVLRGCRTILQDPEPEVYVTGLAESGVTLRVRWWIDPPRILETFESSDEVIAGIKRRLYDEEGIDLPYPTRQVLFHDQTEETDGDRARQREGWPAGRGPVPRPARAGTEEAT